MRDEGSGSVLAVGLCAVLLSGVVLGLGVGSAVVARHRAEAAADLAALAAADVVLGRADGDPCTRARVVLAAHGAGAQGCAVAADGSVTVTATVRAGVLGTARASARAGQAAPQATEESREGEA
ncbi:Rv3654c family TadE-like protein [Kineococcus sp. SYSU DK003]|uniref:Rv3654c family TadE-like protein n=1 Tax=Kineococcus sp. SYSU DK003 TaxID=3383124 RepID=UPI003D7EC4A9